VLPLYIVLMGCFHRSCGSAASAQLDHAGIDSSCAQRPAFSDGISGPIPRASGYFNPYCWQLLFVFGSWCALGGARRSMTFINARATLYFCIAYLILGLVMTMAAKIPDFGKHVPRLALFDLQSQTKRPSGALSLHPFRGDRDSGDPVRPKDWRGLEWRMFDPLIVCGQQSLAVFCVGVFLSFVGHFELMMSSGSLFAQVFVSVTGPPSR